MCCGYAARRSSRPCICTSATTSKKKILVGGGVGGVVRLTAKPRYLLLLHRGNKKSNTVTALLQIFKKHAKLTHVYLKNNATVDYSPLKMCVPGQNVSLAHCQFTQLYFGLPVCGKYSVFHVIDHCVCSFLLVSLIWQPARASSLRRGGWWVQYLEFGLQYCQSYIQHL